MSTTWSFGSTTLSTYGTLTMIADYMDVPERRGENIVIPFRHGTIFVPKYYTERHITIGLAIAAASEAALEIALDTLRTKLSLSTQQTLSQTRADATVRTAQASVDATLQIERFSDRIAKVVIDFLLPFPFFRLSTAIADNTVTVNASPKAWTVTNPGSVEERDPVILLTGPLTNPVITNSTNGVSLTYTGVIASGKTVTIQTAASGEYTATHSTDGDVIGNVSHAGASALMVFNPGANTCSITSDVTTTGTVKASFNAPYI